MHLFDKKNIDQILTNIDKDIWEKYDGNTDMKKYIEKINKLVDSHFGGFPLQIHIPNIDNKKWFTKIYRARRLNDIKNLYLRSEYSYPPACFCKTQRANLAHNPVFYASDDVVTCIKETFDFRLFKSEEICLSSWKIKNNLKFVVSPFIFDSITDTNPYKELSDSIIKRMPNKLDKNLSDEGKANIIESLKFYSELFAQQEKHSISSTLAHKYLYEDSKNRTDIFIYPSVQSDRHTVNFAINPNFVDNHMLLDKIYMLNVSRINDKDDQLRFTFNKYAQMENNSIHWRNIDENDSFLLDSIQDDFSSIMVKDSLKYIKHYH